MLFAHVSGRAGGHFNQRTRHVVLLRALLMRTERLIRLKVKKKNLFSWCGSYYYYDRLVTNHLRFPHFSVWPHCTHIYLFVPGHWQAPTSQQAQSVRDLLSAQGHPDVVLLDKEKGRSFLLIWAATSKTVPSPRDDSDQPDYSRSLIRIFTSCILDNQGCLLFFMRTMKSMIRLHGADAQTYSSLHLAQMFEGTISHVATHIVEWMKSPTLHTGRF